MIRYSRQGGRAGTVGVLAMPVLASPRDDPSMFEPCERLAIALTRAIANHSQSMERVAPRVRLQL
ncbi:hypothetical protein BREVUG8_10311 [Brevundimonas sp. G8]|nr:hypothetical protein BREVUG8_10311 [Brevundimonas sp. G8]